MLAYFSHKTEFLRRRAEPELLTHLTVAIDGAMAVQFVSAPSEVFRKIIHLELCYCVIRHRQWQQSGVFAGMVVSFLCDEFRIPAEAAADLVAATLNNLPPSLTGQDPSSADTDFLRYIFVASATAPDESFLAADLGLGRGLLQRLRQATQGLLAGPEPESQAELCLSPELDAAIQQEMLSLAGELKARPWALDEYRLGFILNEAQQARTRQIFAFLLRLGQLGSATTVQLQQWMSELGGGQSSLELSDLLLLLKGTELIFSEPARRPEQTRYRLARLGEELTAEAFAQSFAPTEARQLLGLSPAYQQALLAGSGPEAVDLWWELLIEHGTSLAPRALESLVARLRQTEACGQLMNALQPLTQTANPRLRQAAVECLRGLRA